MKQVRSCNSCLCLSPCISNYAVLYSCILQMSSLYEVKIIEKYRIYVYICLHALFSIVSFYNLLFILILVFYALSTFSNYLIMYMVITSLLFCAWGEKFCITESENFLKHISIHSSRSSLCCFEFMIRPQSKSQSNITLFL